MNMSTDELPPKPRSRAPPPTTDFQFCVSATPSLIQVPLQENMDLTRCSVCSLGTGGKSWGFWIVPGPSEKSKPFQGLWIPLSLPQHSQNRIHLPLHFASTLETGSRLSSQVPKPETMPSPTCLSPESQHLPLRPGCLGPPTTF